MENLTIETVTIEALAEKLGGNLWVKEDLKRIYLDRGHNTKKMSTKTYVYQKEDGTFGVSCYVDCPSQNINWIKSQQNDVIYGVKTSIDNAIDELTATHIFFFIKDGKNIDSTGNFEALNDLYNSDYFYTEAKALAEDISRTYGVSIASMPIDEFNAEVERLDIIAAPIREAEAIERKIKAEAEHKAKVIELEKGKVEWSNDFNKAIGQEYKHANFGIGKCISEDDNFITIIFAEFGEKKMVKKFTKLEKVG